MSQDESTETFKMNQTTFDALMEIYDYFDDGRIFLARERLEYILGIDAKESE